MTNNSAHVGLTAATPLIMLCTPSDALEDMRTVISTVIHLLKPDGVTELTLSVTVLSQSATLLKLAHLWAAGETDQSGIYAAYPVHTVPGGTVTGQTAKFPLLAHFQ